MYRMYHMYIAIIIYISIIIISYITIIFYIILFSFKILFSLHCIPTTPTPKSNLINYINGYYYYWLLSHINKKKLSFINEKKLAFNFVSSLYKHFRLLRVPRSVADPDLVILCTWRSGISFLLKEKHAKNCLRRRSLEALQDIFLWWIYFFAV